jgi:Protein of unknown function (DUF3300)
MGRREAAASEGLSRKDPNMNAMPLRSRRLDRLSPGLLVVALLLAGGRPARAQDSAATAKPAAAAPADSATKLTADQLQSLVAPIALYPDDLLTQTLVASTYPLEIVALQQYLAKHPDLKDKALADSVAKQPWDPSIQSMAAVPEVVKRLADDIQWTTELGNAFLAQQKEVMDAVQVMRKKAKEKGALESNEQQKVETKVVEKTEVIVVESKNPEVIYVPSYSPTVVYGAPVYPYPPIYYPYYPPGAAFVSFSVGMMWGAAMWGGACCRYGWGGGGNVYINHRNNFNNINVNNRNNINNRDVNRGGNRGNNNWQHNPSHRGGAPYGDRATADKFGGSARGDAAGNRAGASNRASTGQRGTGVSDRSASGRQGGASGNRAGAGAAGGDKIGNQSIPRDAGSRASTGDRSSSRNYGGSSGGFSGGSRGYDGGSARASSSRGASSMGGRGGGGFSRGGGGRRR